MLRIRNTIRAAHLESKKKSKRSSREIENDDEISVLNIHKILIMRILRDFMYE